MLLVEGSPLSSVVPLCLSVKIIRSWGEAGL